MSLSQQIKNALIKELPSGIHLVTTSEISLVKDENKQIIRSEEKGLRIKIQFVAMNPDIKRFEQRFWAKSSLLLKMCEEFGIDALSPKFNIEGLNKRGYVAIKEVRSDTGIDYYIFDFFPWEESLKVPKVDESLFIENKVIGKQEVLSHFGLEKYSDQINLEGTPQEQINDLANIKENIFARKLREQQEEQIQSILDENKPELDVLRKEAVDHMILGIPYDHTKSEVFISLSQKLKENKPQTGPIDWTKIF